VHRDDLLVNPIEGGLLAAGVLVVGGPGDLKKLACTL
jgi:hypothetical protein